MAIEIGTVLTTISSASASFAAILGGFIASKLISINGERNACQSQLTEIKYEKMLLTGERDILRHSLDEEDSICYIHDHMEEFVSGTELNNIYEENELQLIDYEVLLPYWNRAQDIKTLFDEMLQNPDCKFNSDMIPNELAEEYTADLFIYEFMKMYAGWGFSEYFEDCEPKTHANWYERNRQKVMQVNMQVAALDIQEKRYEMDLDRLVKPKGMKLGLVLFAVFSFFNIILPLILCSIPFPDEYRSTIMIISISCLAIGLFATFWYLFWILNDN